MKRNTFEEKDVDDTRYILELVEDKEGLPLDVLDIICQRFPCKALVLIQQGFDPELERVIRPQQGSIELCRCGGTFTSNIIGAYHLLERSERVVIGPASRLQS